MTGFEKKIYRAVLDIPLGETRSYVRVAAAAGSPRGCRAAGNVLNRNPFSPLVACHRVIKSDGSSGGFAGGSRKKEILLRRERKLARCLGIRS